MEVELPFVGTRGLEGTLAAPRTTKPVPNHLSDTSKLIVFIWEHIVRDLWAILQIIIIRAEIFAKASKNGLLQTQPGVIHFDGYTVGKVHLQTLVSKHQHSIQV